MSNYIPPNGYMVNNNLRPQPQPMQATYNPMMNYQQQNNNQQNNNKWSLIFLINNKLNHPSMADMDILD